MKTTFHSLFLFLVTALFSWNAPAQTDALVLDRSGGVAGPGPALFGVDLSTGTRTLITDFTDTGDFPSGALAVAFESPTTALVSGYGGVIMRVDLTTGQRATFGDVNPIRPSGVTIVGIFSGLAVEPDGHILATDMRGFTTNGISSAIGALYRVDPVTNERALVSDFTSTNQGPTAFWPLGVVVESPGTALVYVHHFRPDGLDRGGVFRVDLGTGQRTLVTDYNNATQGTVVGAGPGLALDGPNVLVSGTDLTSVDRTTGSRTVIAQGATAWPQRSANSVAVSTNGILVTDGGNTLYQVDAATGQATVVNNEFGSALAVAVPAQTPATEPITLSSTSLSIRLGPKANDDTFNLTTTATLSPDSNGADLATEDAQITIGTFSATIPAGSFTRGRTFSATVDGVRLSGKVTAVADDTYKVQLSGQRADLTGTTNPVPIEIGIGDDVGTATVIATTR